MFRAAYRSSSGALTVFAASGLHTHVVTGRSQVWVGTGWSITRLHLVGYFYWVILRCTDPWILSFICTFPSQMCDCVHKIQSLWQLHSMSSELPSVVAMFVNLACQMEQITPSLLCNSLRPPIVKRWDPWTLLHLRCRYVTSRTATALLNSPTEPVW